MVKYDMDEGDLVWATMLESTAAAGAPVVDNWGQVIFRFVTQIFKHGTHSMHWSNRRLIGVWGVD